MKRQNIAALIASVFVLAACSGSEPAAEKPAEPAPAAEAAAPASEAAAPATESTAPSDVPPAEAAAASEPASAPAETPSETKPEAAAPAAGGAMSKDEQVKLGKAVFESNCLACHGVEGKGVEGMFPPLAKSDYFAKDSGKIIHAVTKGVNGAIKVNGKEFNGVMPAVPLSDQDVANVVTYVLNSFGNGGGQVSADDVAKIKAQ